MEDIFVETFVGKNTDLSVACQQATDESRQWLNQISKELGQADEQLDFGNMQVVPTVISVHDWFHYILLIVARKKPVAELSEVSAQ